MSVVARTATLLPFSPVSATKPVLSSPARTRRVFGVAGAPTMRGRARTAVARPAATRQQAAAETLRRLAMAVGLGTMLLASVGAAGWGFVAAEQATRSGLAAYVAAPGARS